MAVLVCACIVVFLAVVLPYLDLRFRVLSKGHWGPPLWPLLGSIPDTLCSYPYLYDWATRMLEVCDIHPRAVPPPSISIQTLK